jgi:hypothetical protein
MADEKKKAQQQIDANALRPLLPMGSTGVSWGGEVYHLGGTDPSSGQDASRFYNAAGDEVQLPDDFPPIEEFEQRRERLKRGFSGIPGSAPIQQTISKGSSGSATPLREEDSQGGDDDFESMTKDDLAERANTLNLDVQATGESSEPLKADYVKALRKHAKSQK